MIPRIAVLGGSSVYAPEFIQSVISHNLNVKEIVLIGRSAHKLKLVSGFCQRLLNKRGLIINCFPDIRESSPSPVNAESRRSLPRYQTYRSTSRTSYRIPTSRYTHRPH